MGQRPKMSRAETGKTVYAICGVKRIFGGARRKEKKIGSSNCSSEAQKEVLDWKLHQIRVKDIVTVIYYDKTDYVEQTGMVSRIDRRGISCRLSIPGFLLWISTILKMRRQNL